MSQEENLNSRLLSALTAIASSVGEQEYQRIKERVTLAVTYEEQNLVAKSRRQLRLALEVATLNRDSKYCTLASWDTVY
jgi:hypothetical protein